MSGSLTEKTVRGVITQVSLSMGLKLLAMIKIFVFARIFAPEDFGIFATAGLVVSFVMLFGEMGMNQAIIRHKEDSRKLMDTAFTMNVLVAFLFFAAIFALAPVAAKIFDNSDLVLFIRFLSYSAFGAALTLPSVMWDREMRFGISKLPTLFSLIATFIVTIVAAVVYNLGTWSLFFGGFAGFIANMATIWAIAPYKPHPRFDLSQAKQLYSFGWPLLISSILGFIVWQGDDLMVRYFWGDAELGYYTIAFYMPMYLTQIVNMVSAVLLPAFSKVQDSKEQLEYAFTMSNKYLAIICVPIGMGMCVFAPQIIHYLYSDKWMPAIPLLRLFAIAFTFRVAFAYNWNILYLSKGKTREIMYGTVGLALLTILFAPYLIYKFGPFGGALFNVLAIIIWMIPVRLYFIKKIFRKLIFLKDIFKILLSAILSSGIIIYIINFTKLSGIYVFLEMIIFLMIYLLCIFLFNVIEKNEIGSYARYVIKN
jgi:PST family polysaccharide transporter